MKGGPTDPPNVVPGDAVHDGDGASMKGGPTDPPNPNTAAIIDRANELQ